MAVLFPAGAGVILVGFDLIGRYPSVPRRGGGDPSSRLYNSKIFSCSPQGRG